MRVPFFPDLALHSCAHTPVPPLCVRMPVLASCVCVHALVRPEGLDR